MEGLLIVENDVLGLWNGYVEVFEVLGDLLFDGFVEGLGLGEFDADGFGALLHGWEEGLLWGKLYKGIRNDLIMDGFKWVNVMIWIEYT